MCAEDQTYKKHYVHYNTDHDIGDLPLLVQ